VVHRLCTDALVHRIKNCVAGRLAIMFIALCLGVRYGLAVNPYALAIFRTANCLFDSSICWYHEFGWIWLVSWWWCSFWLMLCCFVPLLFCCCLLLNLALVLLLFFFLGLPSSVYVGFSWKVFGFACRLHLGCCCCVLMFGVDVLESLTVGDFVLLLPLLAGWFLISFLVRRELSSGPFCRFLLAV
jgi:hypothetical protein